MRLSNNNYIKHTQEFREPHGDKNEVDVYSYETHNDLYDVCIWNGKYYYQKNYGGYSYDDIKPIHMSIKKHYSLQTTTKH